MHKNLNFPNGENSERTNMAQKETFNTKQLLMGRHVFDLSRKVENFKTKTRFGRAFD